MSAAAAVLATALVFSPVDATPPPTYFLGGTDLTGTATVTTADIDWLLAGDLTGAQNVPYPRSVTGMDASVGVGADAIINILGDIPDDTAGPVRIAGVSQGALAIAEAKRRVMALDEADRPAADQVVFVAIGDPSGPTGIGSRLPGLHIPYIGVTFLPAPETPYDTIIVTREYDGLADFPDRPLNILATLNAIAGVVYIHPISYGPDTDLAAIPDQDVTETVNRLGGKTTSYFVQNDRLPLLQPLRDLHVDERFVSAIEQPLKQLVDAGYSRNDAVQENAVQENAVQENAVEEDVRDQDDSTATEKTSSASRDRTGYKLSLPRASAARDDSNTTDRDTTSSDDTGYGNARDRKDDRADQLVTVADTPDTHTTDTDTTDTHTTRTDTSASDDAEKAA